jgi:[acyl-carrier-protein] S-malonyltransferase
MTTNTGDCFGVAFPGQGNKRPAVVAALETFRTHPVVAELLRRFGPEPARLDLTDTSIAQPATYAAGIAAAQTVYGEEPAVPLVIGHSLGELTAAACTGVIGVWDGFELTLRRGEVCRDLGRPGAMVAVMGASGTEIEWLRRTVLAGRGGVLEVAGLNSARQTVLSGDVEAVAGAVEFAGELGVLAEVLPISGSFHSQLMHDALPAWRAAVEAVAFRACRGVFLSTIDAATHTDPLEIRELLVRALVLPVRWAESVRAVRAEGVAIVHDAGPGDALTRLGRREGVLRFTPLPAPAGVTP